MLSAVLKLLQHWASRLHVIAYVAKSLLVSDAWSFSASAGARLVGQRDLYPFAVLCRELHMDEIDGRTSIRNDSESFSIVLGTPAEIRPPAAKATPIIVDSS